MHGFGFNRLDHAHVGIEDLLLLACEDRAGDLLLVGIPVGLQVLNRRFFVDIVFWVGSRCH